ncbi:OLC1v1024801C1 [Oldenlandia corymbosa var. corymbosa]|uniref:OLC1v1024801C1 n=1 Tax=Oldenlandia corymbosa var. corymbosa TaxID=529605 RepID=A0AAV1C3P5_OLDCO|nr:OLC1v1024801C1 [Oldenlandia corymbosa var. corymbosa]
MAYQLPDDLIRQVQLATRAESGLSHYDPTQNLSPLPAISETVASFDPSPPYLRCKNCKGRLLRGVQSVLCVYCGRPTDNLHDSICFKDSLAYGWLLESLQLDGSEIVGPLLEESIKSIQVGKKLSTKCELQETNSEDNNKKKKLEVGSPIVFIAAPKAIKTATAIPCLRVNTGLVKPGDVGRIVSRKPKDVWAVRLNIGTYLIDGKYFKALEFDE